MKESPPRKVLLACLSLGVVACLLLSVLSIAALLVIGLT